MYTKLVSANVLGIDGLMVEVEVDISNGLPMFEIVGLPDSSVREAKERVRIAIKNSGGDFLLKRITINLAPADVKKEGAVFDLAIALGVLGASEQIPTQMLEDTLIIGELSLEGALRPLSGVLPMVLEAREQGLRRVLLPLINAEEAALVEDIQVIPLHSLQQAIQYCREEWTPSNKKSSLEKHSSLNGRDFSEVRGQQHVKRAMEVAAAGNHNLLFIGPPGSGKTMLAQRITTILPDMDKSESLEVTKISSIAGLIKERGRLIRERPFRSPHHTISPAGLVGGGAIPKPGEISLAHRGVLFLDEMPEFSKGSLEVLRQPLEDGEVTIGRARAVFTYPADILLVGSLNPCPCGYHGYEKDQACICTPQQIKRYRSKLSGPLLDRIDIHIEVPRVDFDTLSDRKEQETSAQIRERVNQARRIQAERFRNQSVICNSHMSASHIQKHCQLHSNAMHILRQSFDHLGLSARAHDRILKLSRTIADLAGKEQIEVEHIAEAIQYRSLDRRMEE